MNKYIILISSVLFFLGFNAFGEEEWETERRKKVEFSNTLDSLFLENQFYQILELCSQPHPHYLKSTCTYNLIATYYFLGDSVKTWELLNQEIDRINQLSDASAYSLSLIFSSGNYTSFKKFMINSSLKSYLLKIVDSIYRTEANNDLENGIELLHLLIEDQWIRFVSPLYDDLHPERRFPLPNLDSLESVKILDGHNIAIFNFYREKGKVFSEAEVGLIFGWQSLLFFHDSDLERRKFYHKIVIEAVEKGVLEMEYRANFEAGTEYIILGVDEFFRRRSALEESYKKKYGLPDNYRIRLI